MDAATFRHWAKLMHRRSGALDEDAMIAATAMCHQFKVVTRSVAHFSNFGVELVNPFETSAGGQGNSQAAYRDGMKHVAEGRCGSSKRAITSGISATSTPLRQTFSRFARNRIASTVSRACSSKKLASQPASSP